MQFGLLFSTFKIIVTWYGISKITLRNKTDNVAHVTIGENTYNLVNQLTKRFWLLYFKEFEVKVLRHENQTDGQYQKLSSQI